jgi:transcriptional regulator with XRE-family HTH domain
VVNRGSPTVQRRRLGTELRRLREAAGITIEFAAGQLKCSSSKISRMETGHIGASPRDVRDLLTIYGVTGDSAEELIQVAREARQKGWWHAYGTALTGTYVGLEAAARRIKVFETVVVPGLLQIPEYALTVIQASRPESTEEELKRRLQVRSRRQSVLSQDDPTELKVVMDEAVFHRTVGSPSVMAAQLDHLLAMSEKPHVTLQLLPFEAGAHAGMDGAFVILEYENADYPDVVMAENAVGGLFLEKDHEIVRYRSLFDILSASALSPAESVDRIAAKQRSFKQ